MNTSLKSPVTIGILLVIGVGLGIAISTPWEPPSGYNGVYVPDTGIETTAAIQSRKAADTANIVADVPAMIVGGGNDNYRTGVAVDLGTGLIVGSNNKMSNRSNARYSEVVGSGNDVRAAGSLTVGGSNEVCKDGTALSGYAGPASNMLVAGSANHIEGGAANSFVAGSGNTARADTSIIGGNGNTVEGATVGTKAVQSVALGTSNHIMSVSGWAIGSSNEITATAGVALGLGLGADSFCGTFVGTYNEPTGASLTTRLPEDPVFVVGNGNSTIDRSTALVVKRNGDVVIKKVQGDISMGIYGE